VRNVGNGVDRSKRFVHPALSGILAGIALVVLVPSNAHAHLVSTGFGPFVDGITHLVVTPEDLLPLIAISLLAGLRGKEFARAVLLLVPAAWLVSGVFGMIARWDIPFGLTTISFLALGGLVAADIDVSERTVGILAVALGLLHGYLNGIEVVASGIGVAGLLGSIGGLFALLSLTTAFVLSLRASWTRIAVRVAGSWIAAVGLLLLGWSFRPAP
jgi:urease accessory protein